MAPEGHGVADAASVGPAQRRIAAAQSDMLRRLAVGCGVCTALLFVLLGGHYRLQMYADGSLFSYAVAAQDAWTFHYHNISGRLSAYVFAFAPAELYVRSTGDPEGGVVIYGFMFFSAQSLGLLATFAADRSKGRIFFSYACGSTAALCPLVFGFPTEVWIMHALFWPTLALCHFARPGLRGAVLIFVSMTALAFTHEGALISGAAILATLLLRGPRDPRFRRTCELSLGVMLIWLAVKTMLRPDAYVAPVLASAARHVFDLGLMDSSFVRLIGCALLGYAAAVLVLQRRDAESAHVYAAGLVAAALAFYWLGWDNALHAVQRYYLRTVLLVATPALGLVAAAHASWLDGRLQTGLPRLARAVSGLATERAARVALGAMAVLMLIHAVETAKFISRWSAYQVAVRTLAMGASSDPSLGDRRFVSSSRVGPELNRLAWFSTTPFLSVLVAPAFRPERLVVDPDANYFWLSCTTATQSRESDRPVPRSSRELVRSYSCLHRR